MGFVLVVLQFDKSVHQIQSKSFNVPLVARVLDMIVYYDAYVVILSSVFVCPPLYIALTSSHLWNFQFPCYSFLQTIKNYGHSGRPRAQTAVAQKAVSFGGVGRLWCQLWPPDGALCPSFFPLQSFSFLNSISCQFLRRFVWIKTSVFGWQIAYIP